MDSDRSKAIRLAHLQLDAGRHAIKLARVASVFDALIESGWILEEASLEEASNVPAEELSEVPELDELTKEDDDMPLGQAAQILVDFFDMSVDGQARFEVMLGLVDEEASEEE
jgi:hypothetical protein